MNFKMVLMIKVLMLSLFLGGCENVTTRMYGGTMKVNLPCDTKFLHASWKDQDNSIWYSYRSKKPNEQPDHVTFQQHTPLGVLQGKVIFIETNCIG